MKVEVWPEHGPLNSKPIFEAFIESLRNAGEEVFVNTKANADVAVICLYYGEVGWKNIEQSGMNTGMQENRLLY